MAYTSASTALNQKLSENVKANEPTNPLPKTAICFPKVNSGVSLLSSIFFNAILRAKLVIDQNINKMVNALEYTDK